MERMHVLCKLTYMGVFLCLLFKSAYMQKFKTTESILLDLYFHN